VFFAQLGLRLGPEPLVALREAGASVGYTGSRPFEPGVPGSRRLGLTSFGQGAMVMNVMQAARLVAAIGGGGRYRRCPPTMELAAACPEVALLEDPAPLAPILAGMRQVMTRGTGRSLVAPAGVRVYGKTGTADARGFPGEEPFEIVPGQRAAPHSWFVALAEPESNPACAPQAGGRIAVAVAVPRAGAGAAVAGPIAMEIIAVLRESGYLDGPTAGTKRRGGERSGSGASGAASGAGSDR
jgi:cell division protein FtsI/penicillin-binding protein 2